MRFIYRFSIFLFLFTLFSHEVLASGSGLQLSPLKTTLTMDPGSSKSITIKIKNVSGDSIAASPQFLDFVPADDGSAKPIMNDDKTVTPSIRSFLGELKTVSLKKDEETNYSFDLNIPQNQLPGSYWGLITFKAESDSTDKINDSGAKVSLSAGVGHIILVQVTGKVNEKMQLVSLKAAFNDKSNFIFSSPPNKLNIRLKNTGNSFLQPWGKVVITKNGREINTFEINNSDPRGNVLPNSEREFKEDLKNITGFGRYKVVANIAYTKGGGDILSQEINFWVIPSWVMVTGAVGLVAVVGGAIFVAQKLKKRK